MGDALGYANFFANASDYDEAVGDSPSSWAIVPAVRHAMAVHPTSTYFFHLSPHALIMNPTKSLKSHLLDKNRLETLMLKDFPVVPPDSIIRTFSHLKEKDVDLILTQDSEDLCPGSFVLKNGDYGRFFLDVWFDPLFRSYNFAKAEIHGLVRLASPKNLEKVCATNHFWLLFVQDHIMQWHPTILARTAIVPQRTLNAYSKDSSGASSDGTYQDGDFLIRFPGCDHAQAHDCEELESYYMLWQKKTKER